MKLNWRQTFFIALGPVVISLIWTNYNLFVPLFLQAGDPVFDAQNQVSFYGFGLGAALTGVIMTLDNIGAILIAPFIGVWSDRVRTRIGRRYPFILASTPLIALSFASIPLATLLIDPLTDGSVAGNAGAFALFMLAVSLTLFGMAVFRAPARALMPDLTPSPLRSQANGVISFVSGITSVLTALVIARLFDIQVWIPFTVAAVLVVTVIVVQFFSIKEPLAPEETPHTKKQSVIQQYTGLVTGEERRSLVMLMLAVFGFSLGYNALETFYSSYAVSELGVTAGDAAGMFSAALIAFLVCAIPAGFAGERIGRKRAILIGLSIFTVTLGVIFLVPGLVVNAPVLVIGGVSWSLIEVNALPMVLDSTTDDSLAGTYTGFFYFASQVASIISPIITGAVIDWMGRDYNGLFVVTLVFFILAMIFMIFVTRGESHPHGKNDKRLLTRPGVAPLE